MAVHIYWVLTRCQTLYWVLFKKFNPHNKSVKQLLLATILPMRKWASESLSNFILISLPTGSGTEVLILIPHASTELCTPLIMILLKFLHNCLFSICPPHSMKTESGLSNSPFYSQNQSTRRPVVVAQQYLSNEWNCSWRINELSKP